MSTMSILRNIVLVTAVTGVGISTAVVLSFAALLDLAIQLDK